MRWMRTRSEEGTLNAVEVLDTYFASLSEDGTVRTGWHHFIAQKPSLDARAALIHVFMPGQDRSEAYRQVVSYMYDELWDHSSYLGLQEDNVALITEWLDKWAEILYDHLSEFSDEDRRAVNLNLLSDHITKAAAHVCGLEAIEGRVIDPNNLVVSLVSAVVGSAQLTDAEAKKVALQVLQSLSSELGELQQQGELYHR